VSEGSHSRSLEEVHGTVAIPRSWWRRFLAFSGPALMVSVGYMDPGNWGTDLSAGSDFRYRLLWVLLTSNLMALLLQTLATRLGVVTGRDLAQACRESYPRQTVWGLWGLTEIAIAATDLAEVIGTVIGLKLLLVLDYGWGLLICTADTFVLLAVQRRGVRLLELITLALVGTIAVCFFVEIVLADPKLTELVHGFVPGLAPDKEGSYTASLYVAIGMLGATVMPHNLYLHSALVQTRAFPQTTEGKALACKYNFFDSAIALNGAFFVNAAILVLAAKTFGEKGVKVETLQEAHRMLPQALGTALASTLFALALLASGQSSTLTGTLAGQVVMEGFVRLRVQPWVRRLITRLAALAPAILVVALTAGSPEPGDEGASPLDKRFLELLVLSQVILSFQLPFAIIPLIQITSDRRRMGAFASPPLLRALAWLCAAVVVGLNVVLIVMAMGDWAADLGEAGHSPWLIYGSIGPAAVLVGLFLAWVTAYPYLRHEGRLAEAEAPLPPLPDVRYRLIGVGVDFGPSDAAILEHAASLARLHGSSLLIIHVVEGPGAAVYGAETADRESEQDREAMARLVGHLRDAGLPASGVLGYGGPPDEIVRLANERHLDALVLGTHGHGLIGDLALGHTVSPVLHQLAIPVLVVPTARRRERAQEAITSRGSQDERVRVADVPGAVRADRPRA
jgi:manganese transport protein